MPLAQSGGSNVSSSQIIDNEIINADVNANAAINLTKLDIANKIDNAEIADDVVSVATVSLTSNQIKALWGTPVECIPAPGAGKLIIVDEMTLSLTAGVAYTAGQGMNLFYENDNTLRFFTTDIPASVITSATNYVFTSMRADNAVAALGTNKSVQFHSRGGVTEFATGTGTVKLFIRYRVVTL